MGIKKLYKGSNHYAENDVTETGQNFIACTSYTSRVAVIVDRIMFIPKVYNKYSRTTSRHLSKLASHFDVAERIVFDERDKKQVKLVEQFFPEF